MDNPYPGKKALLAELHSLIPWTREIGEHSIPDAGILRRIGMGLGGMFGLPDLTKTTFGEFAAKVETAYRATEAGAPPASLPRQDWLIQFNYLKSWANRGVAGIYQLVPSQDHERFLRVIPDPSGDWILREGHHRCLALWILGERAVWAVVGER